MKICTTCGKEWPDEFKLCPADGSSLRSSSAPEDLVDTIIADRYLILKKLGQGGMGTVYLGEHVKMGQQAAIKVISRHLASDPAAIARFNREARNAAQIKHPNVCMVHDFGETPDGLIYMAMEFIEGEALADLLQREGRFTLQRAAAILMQCCDALQTAHEMDIVHRDVKPENIMITKGRDGADVVKVVDFGIAKAVTQESGQTVTQTGFIVGTPDYMSPDQVSGEVLDGRSDIYSLAVVFYRMVTGDLPFKTDTPHDALMARLAGKPRKLSEVLPTAGFPPALQAVLDKALAQKRDDRYASALEFGRAIQEAVREAAAGTMPIGVDSQATFKLPTPQPVARPQAPASSPTPDTPQPQPSQELPRKKSRAPLVAAAVVILAGGGGFAAWQMTRDAEEPAVEPAATVAADTTPAVAAAPADTPTTPVTSATTTTPTPATPTTGTVVISDLPRGGTITVGGRTVSSPITLAAGAHQLVLQAPGYEPQRVTVRVTAGERQTVVYAAARVAQREEATPVTPPVTRPDPPPAQPPATGRPIRMGESARGTLAANAERFQNRPVDRWVLSVTERTEVEIGMAADFDTYLFLTGPGISQPLTNDDGGDGSNARLVTTLPGPGTYTILASAYAASATGPYTLRVGTPVTLASLPTVPGRPLGLGATVQGALTNADPQYDGRRVKVYELRARAGTQLTISVQSTTFDTYLYFSGPGLGQLTNDDGGGGTNSQLSVTLPEGGTYYIGVSGFRPDARGAFQLTVR